MGSGDAYDVFVSYAHSDEAAAAELNGWLGDEGLRTFFDRRELRPGLRWVPALEEAIGRSKAVAILVGKHGIGNTQQYERELALIRQSAEASFPVIPVLMPGCDSPPTGFLKLLTWVDLSKAASVLQQTDRLADLRAALRGETVASAIRASICPYRGLEPFREEDAAFFCGRDAAIRELVVRVQEHAFVAVVGPSGSGKSSLVFAGLIPALRQQGITTMWDVVTLRPGKSPLRALAEAFGTAPENAGPAAIHTYLEAEAAAYRVGGADMLAYIVDDRLNAMPEKPDRLLIYIDQWEELYAMAPATEDKEHHERHSADVERFIELLVAAASSAGSRANVVLTVRADFYNPLIRNLQLAAILPRQQVNIPPMSRDDLRSAIATPARTAGLSFAPPELVDRILDDVGLEEGRLPLLQFALKETWGNQEGDKLTAEAYAKVGGVTGAIKNTAQGAYDKLTPAQQDAARRLFLRLVTPGEGQPDTRARSLIPEDPQQREIISLFASPKTRLLVTGYETLQGAARADNAARATVEVAHETLIQRWPTLQAWVNDNREKLRDRAALLRFKAEWEENGQDEKFLLDPGVHLERGRALLSNPGDVAVDDIREYVADSIERDQRRLNAERDKEDAQRQKELADQKRIADARKRTTQVAVAGLVVALLVAGFAVWEYFKATAAARLAERATLEAQASAEQAESAKRAALAERDRSVLAQDAANRARLEAQANAERARANAEQAKASLREAQTKQSLFLAAAARQQRATGDSGSAVLLTLEALPDDTGGANRPSVPEAELQLDGALRDLRERLVLSHDAALQSAAFSPDGKRIVTAFGNTARQWDVATGQPVGLSLRGHGSWVWSGAYSPDGKRIVTASADKTARIWDAETGQPVGTLIGHEAGVRRAAFSPDGKLIATASDDGTARVWEATGRPVGKPLVGHEAQVWSAAFSPDSKRIVTASFDGSARIWDVSTGRQIGNPLNGHKGMVWTAAFSLDGKRIVTASYDGTARIWNAATGQPIGEPLKGHDGEVLSAAFSPDGTLIVTAAVDKTARIWDASTGKLIDTLAGHDGEVASAAFSPDGGLILTASDDKTARLWDAVKRRSIGERLTGHGDEVTSAAFSPDGKRIVTASYDKTARLWDAVTGQPIGEPLRGHEDRVESAAFSPDGKRIVTASRDTTALIWDAGTGQTIGGPLMGHTDWVLRAAFSPDGKRIVTASRDGTARIWDASTDQSVGEPLKGHRDAVSSAAFSPDGQSILTASYDGTVRTWSAVTGQPIGEPIRGHDNWVLSAAFSPDGKRIVTASYDKTARLWDAATGQPIGELIGHNGPVSGAAFSSDGRRIVTASWDGTVRVWDAADHLPLIELKGHENKLNSASFSSDDKRIVTASADGTARLWDVPVDAKSFEANAKAAIPRCLTRAQRKSFFLSPEPPMWCIEMAKWPYNTPEWKRWQADKGAGKDPPLPAAP